MALAALGCSVARFENTSETDAVFTGRDPEIADFSMFETYALPDEVFDLSDFVDDPIPRSGMFDDLILETVADNMARLGYQRVDVPDDPLSGEADLILAVGAVAQDNWTFYCYPWPIYPGYWWCYPGWGAVPVNTPTGTLILTMIDPTKAVPPTDPDLDGIDFIAPVVWGGAISGVLSTSESNNAARIVETLDQAFAQSGYLRIGEPVEGM
ncbi:MAG: DUF4136 domain-containing protein [Sandaracinaceae bacterium]